MRPGTLRKIEFIGRTAQLYFVGWMTDDLIRKWDWITPFCILFFGIWGLAGLWKLCQVSGPCDHGLRFDSVFFENCCITARKNLPPMSEATWHASQVDVVRRLYPRLDGECPKGCGYSGIAYASVAHYVAGDW